MHYGCPHQHAIASLWMYPQPHLPKVGNLGRSEEPHRLAHGGLDVQGLDVLPVLLQQRDEEIDGWRKIDTSNQREKIKH